MEDYYSVLGVSETATQDEIKKEYRKLVKENHPDKGGDEEKFKKISTAYDTIGDENKRRQYDQQKNNPFANMGGFGGASMDDMINNMFGGNRRQQNRVHDTVIDVNVGVLESYRSGKKTITYNRKGKCDPCNGTGGEKKVCHTCGGQGFTVKQMGSGMFIQIMQVACNTCNGVGKITTAACYVCGGQGVKNEIKTVDIQLPHGIDDGQFLRLQGLGDYRNGGYGNLVIRIRTINEGNFEKAGPNLVYNAFLNIEDFQKGSFDVPHPDGVMNIKFPNNIDTSMPLRVKGKGFKYQPQGDLLINQYLKFNRS
jgi:molecular chaperone DnaJ